MLPALPLLALLAASPPGHNAALDQAISLFDNFDDEHAAALLRQILSQHPSGIVTAKAHVYLGLVALNAIDPDLARLEFRLALVANPETELPPGASPKARLAFEEAKSALEKQLATAPAPATSTGPAPAPATSTASAPLPSTSAPKAQAVTQPPAARSHGWAYVLGATTLVFAAAAVYGGVNLLQYQAAAARGTPAAPQSYAVLKPAYDQARFWAYGWPVAAGLAAGSLVGAGFAW